MSNKITFRDEVTLSFLNSNLPKIKDDYNGAFKPVSQEEIHPTGMGTIPGVQQTNMQQTKNGLLVSIAATHAGIVNKNNMFYIPDKMAKGASTFVENYGKPILVHHNAENSDPIGRVVKSKYVDTSNSIQDRFRGKSVWKNGKKLFDLNDQFMNDFTTGKMPFGQQVDVIRDVFRKTILDEATYEGLGYIQIVANITDPDAIQKLLDGRYLTGSVGASTDTAICSVCRTNWGEDGKCEHTPGAVYDSVKCFLITGALSYDEFSFVNKPADKYAKVIQFHHDGIQDSVNTLDQFKGRIYEVQVGFPQYDSVNKEEGSMPNKGDLEIRDSEINESLNPSTEQDTKETENLSTEPKNGINDSADLSSEEPLLADGKKEDIKVEDKTSTENLESDEDFLAKMLELEDSVSTEDEEKAYEMFWKVVQDALADGELSEDLVKDAKLSTEARSKLPKSSFCGPNRSFPVNDNAHVIAARRLLNKVKVSDLAKEKISACVERKAKLLGCKTPEVKDVVQKTSEVQDGMNHMQVMHSILGLLESDKYYSKEQALTDEEVVAMQNMLTRLSKLVTKDSFSKSLSQAGLGVNDQVLLDEIAKYENKVIDLQDSLSAVRKEYGLLLQDMELVQDNLIDTKKQVRSVKEQHLKVLQTLKDGKVEEVDFTQIQDSVLSEKLEGLTKEVDFVKITDKLCDGMSRVPEGTVDSPVEILDKTEGEDINNGNNVQKSKEEVGNTLQQIRDTYLLLRKTRGINVADSFLENCRSKKIIPEEGK